MSGACSALATGRPGIAVPPGMAQHIQNKRLVISFAPYITYLHKPHYMHVDRWTVTHYSMTCLEQMLFWSATYKIHFLFVYKHLSLLIKLCCFKIHFLLFLFIFLPRSFQFYVFYSHVDVNLSSMHVSHIKDVIITKFLYGTRYKKK